MNILTGLKDSLMPTGSEPDSSNSAASSDVSPGFSQDYSLAADQATGNDERFMARALYLAQKGIYTTHPNPVVGCVVVKNGVVLGESWHRKAGEDHAEVIALKQAGKAAKGATLYVTLEPCSHYGKTPPCVKPIIKSGISRVVAAMEDPNPLVNRSGISELQRAGLEVLVGIGGSRAKYLNRGFLKRITTGAPWVTLKIATSLDGKTAMANGESQWITSEPARYDSHKLRASSSAVLTGIGTVLRDDPSMNTRIENVTRQPTRVVLDTNLSIPENAKIFSTEGQVLVFTASRDEDLIESLNHVTQGGAEIFHCGTNDGAINLKQVMQELGARKMNTILLEAGSRLSGNMLKLGLVDEIVVYMAPDLLGGAARDMFTIPGLDQLSEKIKLEYTNSMMIGRDLKLTLKPVMAG